MRLTTALMLAALAWAAVPSRSVVVATTMDVGADLPVDRPIYQQAGPHKKEKPPKPTAPPNRVQDLLAPPVPQPELYGKPLPSRSDSVVFVLDISGSMAWEDAPYTDLTGAVQTGPRMARARVALQRGILSLRDGWRFNVVAYDHTIKQLWPELVRSSEASRQGACAWVAQLHPGGSTATGPAVAQALWCDRTNMLVVLVSDGAPNVGVSPDDGSPACAAAHRQMIRFYNTQKATVDVFGISATGAMRQFCLDVAAENRGAFTDVR